MTGRHSRDDEGPDAPDAGDDDDDEAGLFRRLMADARRIESDRAPPEQARPAPRASFARRERSAVLRESLEPEAAGNGGDETGELRFQHPSVSRNIMRRLARGGFSRRDEIDLHGLTRDAARTALLEFIAECVSRGHTCVRVVHGKGRGSGPAGPVLKRMVDQWLRRLEPVLAYVTARPVDGGSGAVYVLLRRQDRQGRE